QLLHPLVPFVNPGPVAGLGLADRPLLVLAEAELLVVPRQRARLLLGLLPALVLAGDQAGDGEAGQQGQHAQTRLKHGEGLRLGALRLPSPRPASKEDSSVGTALLLARR